MKQKEKKKKTEYDTCQLTRGKLHAFDRRASSVFKRNRNQLPKSRMTSNRNEKKKEKKKQTVKFWAPSAEGRAK